MRARFARLVPAAAKRAFQNGDERLAATLLHRARSAYAPGSAEWAILERLEGLLWIAVQREVEGTFALDRADRVLDGLELGGLELDGLELGGAPCTEIERPDLDWLE